MMLGKKKLTQKEKDVLKGLSGNICENCLTHEKYLTKPLEIHRIIRGVDGGTYLARNCKILCSDCHNRFDYGGRLK